MAFKAIKGGVWCMDLVDRRVIFIEVIGMINNGIGVGMH
jgi:hypothetical protein